MPFVSPNQPAAHSSAAGFLCPQSNRVAFVGLDLLEFLNLQTYEKITPPSWYRPPSRRRGRQRFQERNQIQDEGQTGRIDRSNWILRTSNQSKGAEDLSEIQKGSRVRFQIRKKNLTGKGFNIDFAHGSKKVVEFNNFDQGDTANVAQTAEITRKGKRAKRGLMIFTITDFSTGTPVINTVTYYLK